MLYKLRRDTSWLAYNDPVLRYDPDGLIEVVGDRWIDVGWCQVERYMPPTQYKGVDGLPTEYKMRISFRRGIAIPDAEKLKKLRKGVTVRISQRNGDHREDTTAVILAVDQYSWRYQSRLVLWV